MMITVEAKLAQALAANDKKRRDGGLKKLAAWLSARSSSNDGGVFEEELMKLWKGLFYCMWMSDKPLVQEELADNISELIHIFNNSASSLLFIECFFKTMNREWPGLDQWRMDKYMMFCRKFLEQSFVLLKKLEWRVEAVENFTALLSRTAARANGYDLCVGFQVHIADIYVEELSRVAADTISGEQIVAFFEPYCHVLAKTKSEILRDTVVKRVFEFAIRLSDPEEAGNGSDMGDDSNANIENNDENAVQSKDADDDDDEEDYEVSDDSNDDDELDIERQWRNILKRHEMKAQLLPFPKFDYKRLGDRLLDVVGKAKDCTAKMRAQSYKIVKNLHEMAAGIFPLDVLPENLPEDSDTEDDEELIEDAVKDLNKFEEKLRQENLDYSGNVRRRKREYIMPKDSHDDEDSDDLKEDDMEATSNAVSKRKMMKQKKKQQEPVKKAKATEVIKDKLMLRILRRAAEQKAEDMAADKCKLNDTTIAVKNREAKKRKVSDSKPDSDSVLEVAAKNCNGLLAKSSPVKTTEVKKKRRKISRADVVQEVKAEGVPLQVNCFDTEVAKPAALDNEKVVKKPAVSTQNATKRKGRYFNESIVTNECEEISLPENAMSSLNKSNRKSNESKQQSTPFVSFKSFKKAPPAFFRKAVTKVSPKAAKKVTPKLGFANLPSRKVNFELTKNGAQEVKDYALSVRSSPNIPFDSSKLPTQGVLKLGLKQTPVRKRPVRRQTAKDFF